MGEDARSVGATSTVILILGQNSTPILLFTHLNRLVIVTYSYLHRLIKNPTSSRSGMIVTQMWRVQIQDSALVPDPDGTLITENR